MANVALFIFGINDLSGGGGAERFFADFFDIYNSRKTKHKLYYIIDKNSRINLQRVNKLNCSKHILNFIVVSNRFKNYLEFLQLLAMCLFNRIRLIHVPLYSASYLPLIKKINRLPSWIRPKITVNIVNCYVPQALSDSSHPQHIGFAKTYGPLLNELIPDGYFCWNTNFIEYLQQNKISRPNQILSAIKSRFSDTKKFFPEEKANTVVFASRLDNQKHPDWFVEAIADLKKRNEQILRGWKFIICGKGPLAKSLKENAEANKLGDLIEFKEEGELWKVFNHSKAFVSCQDYDNFPSLAMAEAMASGNAIIARNVGQTELFVKHMKNGLILKEDSYKGLSEALEYYMGHAEIHESLSKESLRLIQEVHTPENFILQIDQFWDEVLLQKKQ